MIARVTSALLVSALSRRVQAEGGNAAILVKGDPTAGAVLLVCCERGAAQALLERVLDQTGAYRWSRVGPLPIDAAAVNTYVEKRRKSDPDIWVVELDVPGVQRFTAEMTGTG